MWLLATVLGNADLDDVFLSGRPCVGRTELWFWNLTAQGPNFGFAVQRGELGQLTISI